MEAMLIREWDHEKIIKYSNYFSIDNISKIIYKTYLDLLTDNKKQTQSKK
jgi:hypothetical protein